MAEVIKVTNFERSLKRILKVYADDISKGMKAAAKSTARVAAQEVKRDAPYGRSRRHYREGWTVTDASTRVTTHFVVRNRTKYQIAHLLEKGHAKRGGGRTRALEHIAPAEQRAIKRYEKAVKELAKKG